MIHQSEIIAAGRALLNEPEVGEMLTAKYGPTWKSVQHARAIAKIVLEAAKTVEPSSEIFKYGR